MTFGIRLRTALEHLDWSPKDLANRSGVAYPTVSALIRRESDLTHFKETLIGHIPETSVNHHWLRTGEGAMTPKNPVVRNSINKLLARYVPVQGMARMGVDGFYEEVSAEVGGGDGCIAAYTQDENAYALRVRGDSMTPAIRDGWFVVIEPGAQPVAGEYVLIKLATGERMVKELLYLRNDSVSVISINGDVRTTILLSDLAEHRGIQAVSGILPPSKWMPTQDEV